ncbi:MAG: ABC transporter ATP-binding protein [Lentisphaerae bacterium]|nr:ABC transporter ATP-binding protein [Lentisphaerota bacterium]
MNVVLQSIVKRFGAVTAVDNVSLEIRAGECFFLLGPSGCGKTTLLRIIAGFCAPDEGQLLFDGKQVGGLPPHRRNTGMVFQNYALWPHLTVAANVAFGLTVPGRTLPASERKARVQRMLAVMHLEDYAGQKPNQLSGGQQQRVALARALVIDPACLLLDEPLSNLDAKLRLEMRVEIRRLVKRLGITTIYVTHDQKEALSMADRCAVLRQGRVEQIGTPRDLYERPANRFVADFIGGANLVPGTVRALTPLGAVITTAFGECSAHNLRGALQPGAKVTLAIRPEHLSLGAPCTELPARGGSAPGGNWFKGHVTESVYSGDTIESWIRMSDGSILKSVASATGRPATAAADIPFHVNPDEVIVLAAE